MLTAPFDQRDGYIWMNDEMTPWRAAKLHVLSHGLHYASAVFEGERAYGGAIFQSRAHAERLHRSAHIMDFEIPFTVDEIEAAKAAVVAANGFSDCYVRAIAWRGSEMMAVSSPNATIQLAIAAWDWPSMFDMEAKMKGLRLEIAQYRRPDPQTIPCAAKAAGLYMICTISKHRAERAGFADALMLDWRGYVAECTGANIMFVKEGALHTPLADCFLDGITRQTVMALAHARGVKTHERHIRPEELADMEECFLCGTGAEITPVAEIGPYKFKPGAISRQMIEDYAACVRA